MEITIIILSSLLLLCGYIIYNLLKKVEKQEDILIGYNTYLNKISDIIELSDNKMKQVDATEHFKGDDEVGFFFEEIKSIQEILSKFIVKEV